MLLHQTQDCFQITLICRLRKLFDRLISSFNELREEHSRQKILKRFNSRYYQKCAISELRDLGLDDPQVQIRVLGQFIESEHPVPGQIRSGSWWGR